MTASASRNCPSLVIDARLDPDIRRAVATQEANLVRPCGSCRLRPKIDTEILVQLHPARLRIAIDLQQRRALFSDLRIELIVPARKERVGDVQPLAVEAELQHLRPAGDLLALHRRTLAFHAT